MGFRISRDYLFPGTSVPASLRLPLRGYYNSDIVTGVFWGCRKDAKENNNHEEHDDIFVYEPLISKINI
jgi:hypothetical protein